MCRGPNEIATSQRTGCDVRRPPAAATAASQLSSFALGHTPTIRSNTNDTRVRTRRRALSRPPRSSFARLCLLTTSSGLGDPLRCRLHPRRRDWSRDDSNRFARLDRWESSDREDRAFIAAHRCRCDCHLFPTLPPLLSAAPPPPVDAPADAACGN